MAMATTADAAIPARIDKLSARVWRSLKGNRLAPEHFESRCSFHTGFVDGIGLCDNVKSCKDGQRVDQCGRRRYDKERLTIFGLQQVGAIDNDAQGVFLGRRHVGDRPGDRATWVDAIGCAGTVCFRYQHRRLA